MMDFIPEAQALLNVVASVESDKPALQNHVFVPDVNIPQCYHNNKQVEDIKRQLRSVARELINFWCFEPARVDHN